MAARAAAPRPALIERTRTERAPSASVFGETHAYGDPGAPNRLVHGDNLAAMEWLARDGFAGRFRCAYLDPPFNTGRVFAGYDDARAPAEWRAMMHARLAALRTLVADDGAVFAEIDDTELGALQGLMDDVFGRANRVATVTVVRSASTGHKAQNAGPVNVADYVLIYAKQKAEWRSFPQTRERRGYDFAYGTFVENPSDPPERWTFEPLAKRALYTLGHTSMREATKARGRDATLAAIARFAMENAAHVVRFAQPRYEAVSREARARIDESRADPTRVIVLERPGLKDMWLRGGNRILRLADKVRFEGGRAVIVEPLTNVWDDMPFQGIAREGGVVFARSKKPERLLERVLAMSTEAGDWVLDPFLGSGTTAAVAHKMGRRWVGIEEGDQLRELCEPRLRRVIDGEDASGITRARKWRGGGGFGVFA